MKITTEIIGDSVKVTVDQSEELTAISTLAKAYASAVSEMADRGEAAFIRHEGKTVGAVTVAPVPIGRIVTGPASSDTGA